MSEFCPDCVEDASLGAPSHARWIGPDGGRYCSIHFIRRFGHRERLIKIEDYEAPTEVKPPLPPDPPPAPEPVEVAEVAS